MEVTVVRHQNRIRSTAAILGPVILSLAGQPAQAEQIAPMVAEVARLDTVSAITYYTEERDGFRVVITIQDDRSDATTPVRFVATLQPGQKAVVSVPGLAGEPPKTLEVKRDGERLFVEHHAPTVSVAHESP
jgi:hypothetical protein